LRFKDYDENGEFDYRLGGLQREQGFKIRRHREMASAGNLEDAALSGRPYMSTPNVYPARLRAVPLKELFIAEGD
jgi:hypothetical protein